MYIPENLKNWLWLNRSSLAFIIGVLLLPVISVITSFSHTHKTEEVHVHSDILVFVDGEVIDFSGDAYQSSAENILHPDFHFHDNNDDVIHRHAAGLTLAEFFSSLGYTLTNDCITDDNNTEYCSNEADTLTLYVNNEPVANILSYVPNEEDRILLYYGPDDESVIKGLQADITTDACIYSGTCPERGTPPPESCGLTCEI